MGEGEAKESREGFDEGFNLIIYLLICYLFITCSFQNHATKYTQIHTYHLYLR